MKTLKPSKTTIAALFVFAFSLALGLKSHSLEEVETQPSKTKKFITLTVGIESEEKLPPMPSVLTFKGDFKKITTASYQKDSNTIKFSPKNEGIAPLTIHDKSGKKIFEYHITVRKSKLDTVAKEVQGLLADIEGITIKIANNKVVVDGQILLPRDMSRIHNVLFQFGDQVASLVTMSPLAQKKIAEFIARDINNPEVEVRAVNDKFILQGTVNSEDEYKRAEIIAKTYVPAMVVDKAEADSVVKKPKPTNDGIINLLNIRPGAPPPPPKMIQLVLHYVELNKDYTRGFRFQFMPTMKDGSGITFSTGANSGTSSSTSFSGTIENLFPKLNWAKNHGHARVLESSSLIVQDGSVGVLKSEKDIPYLGPPAQPGGAPVPAFKTVGISSNITPVLLGERSDSIQMKMIFELSALVGTVNGAPLTSKNTINTDAVVRSGQSAAIGGLITNRSSTGYNKLPPDVSSNPIVSLYASKDFTRGQSQFVVFITPIVKSSASAGAEKIKKKFRLRD
ncbi:MAG: hypothetical protein BroJett040_25460 [Oligoflexia bacterium]|nr:MAG: hypothetical protein BroJett040_25460 [Oligoflexia bacterium]